MHLGNRSGHAEVVRLLLARGADVTARCTKAPTDAQRKEHVALVRVLQALEGAV